ncbi:uncharacterized protein BJ171DRAFT_499620 [Polychytrium aggregatum]|uniref:uncharacterized protein n=1 Tax=Polychytrium aggregatum TaxID=110093 RepID=UPI0022FEF155|nr:uncharacterized protein BJ171DRAFT_499620 [Polychytrium aggregatum]KAI9205795.1 hypothetical protein BJ171DRAFT_499620 [Polychytrium aggregatum]
MSRHSKNNTALAFFTAAERAELGYGTQKQRLGRDSMRDFDACFLCLQTARSPLSCPKGHLACKECIYENILSQKKEIARKSDLKKLYESQQEEEVRAKELVQREQEIAQFEKTQTKLLAATETEAKGQNKPALPSFWTPSLTPTAKPDAVTEVKTDIVCTASTTPHPIMLKKLVPIVFTPAKGAKTSASKVEHMCPSCLKTLTNGVKMMFLKPCGHVFCKHCCQKFIKEQQKCFVCDTRCKDKDMVELHTEGTGFVSGGGQVEAKKVTVAFQ